MGEEYIRFCNRWNDKELCAVTAKDTFDGEVRETIKLLAFENGLTEEDIIIELVKR